MAGTGWTSVDLLARFNQLAGRGSNTADAVTPAVKYQFLADGEAYTIDRLCAVPACAKALFGAPAALTSADGGYTFTFGTDGNGYALFPMGSAGIYPSLTAIPGGAWRPGIDYLDEGTTIRMPNNVPYTGTLYWYGVTPRQQMSATVQPVLNPPPIRMLAVRRAVATFAETGNIRNEALANRMAALFEKELGEAATLLRKHFKNGGAMGRLLYPWGVGAYTPGFAGQWW